MCRRFQRGGRGKASGSLARCRICELGFHPLGRRAMVGDEQWKREVEVGVDGEVEGPMRSQLSYR